MKSLFLFLLFALPLTVFGQTLPIAQFGHPSPEELALMENPVTDNQVAVVTYERGTVEIRFIEERIMFLNTIHRKIKVLDPDKFAQSEWAIRLYKGVSSKEELKELEVITHNGEQKTALGKNDFYMDQLNQRVRLVKFASPQVKAGSLIEYRASWISPFINHYDWDFQGDYPKMYSEYHSKIAGNLEYRTQLIGTMKLDTVLTDVKRKCLKIAIFENEADCRSNTYVMRNIPEFVSEDHMLGKQNYQSSLKAELTEFISFTGQRDDYAKTWEGLDKTIKHDLGMGSDTDLHGFFERKLPAHLYKETDKLQKAKNIYYYVQKNLKWNGIYNLFSGVDIKDAWKKGRGSSSEVNLALYNALNSAGLDVKVALGATRGTGLPSYYSPVLTDFNWVLVHLEVDGNAYWLDGTEESLSFGYPSYRSLNAIYRIMDFKNPSEWASLNPPKGTSRMVQAQIEVSPTSLEGKAKEQLSGYQAIDQRANPEETENREINSFWTLKNIKTENLAELDKSLVKTYGIHGAMEEAGSVLLMDPFQLLEESTQNPFQLEERSYPVDFGYPTKLVFQLVLDIDAGLAVESYPQSQELKLSDNSATCKLISNLSNNQLVLRYLFKIDRHHYPANRYPELKTLLGKDVEIRTNGQIVFKRI